MECARLSLLLLLISVNSVYLRGQIVSGPITNPANAHWYYLVGPTYWTNAEAQAKELEGHLVTVNDAAENDWVLQTFGSYGNLFLGFTDEAKEGTWVWTSGEPVTYTHWNAGEPNNGGGGFPYENYSMMYGSTDPSAGFWNDIIGSDSTQKWWGVVEVEALRLSIRVSEVEVCWPTTNGVAYQLQYSSPQTTNTWQNLGSPTNGTGSTICVHDPVPIGDARRLYRVVQLP